MNFKERCIQELDEGRLFENSGHRTRFKELLDCYENYPFFSKGLCKCMYLSAWDEEHFAMMLGVLTELTLGREKDTMEMRLQGEQMAKEHRGREHIDGDTYIYQLSNAFLDNREFHIEEGAQIEPEYEYIIRRGLAAAERIEKVNI
ncbi:MAG: hypothetical protein HFG56_07300 [Lachnospiraceae bacterium]|nr:hypothetical protein [Lachnospiraceae bacterium]MCI9283083.1 hypothetical protein [Lachnospiraceae bacterium]